MKLSGRGGWNMIDPQARQPGLRPCAAPDEGDLVDAGAYDEYQLQVGARVLHRRLDDLGIAHTYENTGRASRHHYRYANSLARLYEALR